MKKNFKTVSVVITLVLLSLQSCKKNNEVGDVLPPVTSSGANTFGCILDEKVFAVKKKCNYSVGLIHYRACVDVDLYNESFVLNAEDEGFIYLQDTKIYISVKTDSNYTNVLHIYNSRITINKNGYDEYYDIDRSQNNELKIINKRYADISGIFTLHYINTTGQRKILKDGRFDVQF